MSSQIVFPEVNPSYMFEEDCLAFRALVDGKTIECLVTGELLMHRFGASAFTEDAFREAFGRHETEILAIARQHIESGWIDEEGRLALTTRFTRLTVTFGGRLNEWPEGHSLAASAHRVLTEIIGPNAEEVIVEWGEEEPLAGKPDITLRIIDPSLSYAVKLLLGPKEREDPTWLRLTLASTWGSVLQARSRKLILKSG